MHVGIMSMQRIVNHGSFMQAYGLKSMLESMGNDVVFVDYRPEPCAPGVRGAWESLKDWLGRRKADARFTRLGRSVLIAAGIYRMTPMDIEYERCLELLGVDPRKRNIGERVDTLVIGSDEVFNCTQAGPNVGFCRQLLGSGNNCDRLISYAGSFGHTTSADLERYGIAGEVASCFASFDAISVRDVNSKDILEGLGFKNLYMHLDPVLVSGVEDMSWSPVDTPKRYALVYGYRNRFTAAEGDAIAAIAKSRGVELLAVYGHQSFCDKNVDCGPDEILSYFKGADFVVTDTFHGSIFSAITHTPFAVVKRSQNANKLSDLLKRLALTDRLASAPEEFGMILESEQSFEESDRRRALARCESLAYLREYTKPSLGD